MSAHVNFSKVICYLVSKFDSSGFIDYNKWLESHLDSKLTLKLLVLNKNSITIKNKWKVINDYITTIYLYFIIFISIKLVNKHE